MQTETAGQYAQRVISEMGLKFNDTERALIWAYDHPPKKPLPKPHGERERNIFLSRRVVRCLAAASNGNASSLAESILLLWINENVPQLDSMYERHEQEIEARIAELRRNEPELQPQHCSSDIGEAE